MRLGGRMGPGIDQLGGQQDPGGNREIMIGLLIFEFSAPVDSLGSEIIDPSHLSLAQTP